MRMIQDDHMIINDTSLLITPSKDFCYQYKMRSFGVKDLDEHAVHVMCLDGVP